MAQAPTQDFIVNAGLNVLGTATVTSSTGNTGTLQVDGGAAIAQNLIVGTNAIVYGDLTVYGNIPSVSITTGTFTNLTVTDLSTLNAVTAGVTTASQLDVAARLAVGGLSQLNNVTLANATNSTSSTTGALQVTGGVGIQKDLWVGGQAYVHGSEVLTTATLVPSTLQAVTEQGSATTIIISLLNTASSTSTTTGALIVKGGVGIGGDLYANALYINTASYINNSLIITTATVDLYATKTSILAGTDTAVNTSTGIVTIWNTSTLQSVTDRGNSTNNAILITNSTSATSTSTGALQVRGGVGIGGALYVGTASYINNSRILIAADLETVTFTATYITNDPTSQIGLAAIANTTTVYGTYNFGTVTDISTINDYNTGTNTGFYSINDAASAPAYVVYIGFSNVTDFTRLVLNVNYTSNSGHTVEIDLYNYVTLTWDTLTTYSGSVNWFQFILGVIDSAPYMSGGKVVARIYHVSAGNTAHRTWIDYAALENSVQGGQGPRGATGATGAQGPQGLTTSTTSTFIFFNTSNSTSTNTGAVVAYGGMGIGGNLYVGGTLNANSIIGNITTATSLSNGIAGQVPYQTAPGVTSFYGPGTAGDVLVSGNSSGPRYQNTLTLAGTASSTSSVAGNALQIAGGVGIGGGLFVQGTATFASNVIFNGTTTYVLSTNTVYTDNIVELHYPLGTSTWSVNDGKDIGFRFHYYDTQDNNAFLGRDNATGYLEWVGVSGDDTQSNVTGTNGTFRTGAIILTSSTASNSTNSGALQVVGGAGIGGGLVVGGIVTSTNLTNAISTLTGALQIAGGAGIQQDVYIGGNLYVPRNITVGTVTATSITATNLFISGSATIPGGLTATNFTTTEITVVGVATLAAFVAAIGTVTNLSVVALTVTTNTNSTSTTTGAVVVTGGVGIGRDLRVGGTIYGAFSGTVNGSLLGNATSATNLASGTAGQVPYQTAPNVTSFYGPGTAGNVLVSNGTGAPSYNNTLTLAGTTTSISTTTGALQVRGGVGVGGSVYVGNRVGFVNTAGNASVVYQFYNTLTNSLDTVFG